MSEPSPSPARTAALWCFLGSLCAGLALPLTALFLSPDQIFGTTAPLGAIARSTFSTTGVGFLVLTPIAVALALAGRRYEALAHGPRVLAVFVALAPIPVTGWFFYVRNARLDFGTMLGGLGVLGGALGLAILLGVPLQRLDKAGRWLVAVPFLVLFGALFASGIPAPLALTEGPLPDPVPYTAPGLVDANPERPRNVLFLTIDTLRADHLGAWGYPRATSPVLDALAADGLRVKQMTAASSGTVPSFGTLHTGLIPECTGVVHQLGALGPGAVTLAERFDEAGYHTMAVVTNHSLDEEHGFDQGFDHFDNLGEAQGNQVVDRAIEQWPDDEPVFAWVHLFDPHTPYQPPDALIEDFRGDELWDDVELPVIDFGSWGGVHRDRTLAAPIRGRRVPRAELVAAYDAEIAFADEQVGRLLEWLDRTGKLDDTLIVFTSDHGETLTRGPRDVYFQHALQTFDDDLKIPTFLWDPTRIPTGEIEVVTRHIDVVPTLLDAARLPSDAGLPGRSLLRSGDRSTVAIARNAWWDGVSLQLVPLAEQGATRSVEHDGWKLVRTPKRSLTTWTPAATLDAWRGIWSGIHQGDKLFHIAEDPGETTNLIDEHPDVLTRLEGILAAELERGLPDSCRDTRGTDVELDAETRERLKRMGYLD